MVMCHITYYKAGGQSQPQHPLIGAGFDRIVAIAIRRRCLRWKGHVFHTVLLSTKIT